MCEIARNFGKIRCELSRNCVLRVRTLSLAGAALRPARRPDRNGCAWRADGVWQGGGRALMMTESAVNSYEFADSPSVPP